MDIYFFSSHDPDPEMIQDLGNSITAQFKGSISDIFAIGNEISFTETLHIGGQICKVCHTIPAESIVVTEAPVVLQEAWLKAGVATLLIPQVKQVAKGWGHHAFKYDGLTQVHKIEVVTSPWARRESEKTVKHQIQNPKPAQPTHTASFSQVLNLFSRLIWKPAIPSVSH